MLAQSINISLASQMIVATELPTLQFLSVRVSLSECVRFPVWWCSNVNEGVLVSRCPMLPSVMVSLCEDVPL